MGIKSKELREKRAKLVRDARVMLDKAESENRDPNTEERAMWDRVMGSVGSDGNRIIGEEERMKDQIDRLERQEKLEEELRSPIAPAPDGNLNPNDTRGNAPSEVQRALGFQAWVRAQAGMDLREDHIAACQAVGIKPHLKELPINLRSGDYRQTRASVRARMKGIEMRAGASAPQSATLVTSGGYTVPEGFIDNLEMALLQYGGIRDAADVMRTATGNDLPWPTVNDTSVKGAILGENVGVSTGDMTFGAVVFHAYKYTSKLILVPVELIEDSAFELATFIGDACGIRIARIQADHFTTGTGAGQPYGAVTAATLGVTAASSTAIAADEIYGLIHSVDPAYRQTGCAFSFHDQILLAIKKLKDGLGRYLWQSSLADGAPDTLDGHPIIINQSMPSSIATGAKTMLFGQHSKYKIRDVAEVRLRRLVERYADQDQEGFVMFMRSDGNLLDAGTHPLKYLAQA